MSKYDMTPCTHRDHISDSDCCYAHKRLNLEARIVRALIRGLKREGWLPTRVNDGGDELVTVKNETEAMDAVFSVDESAIGFSKGADHNSFMVVLGNGIDCICDWTFDEGDANGFSALMDRLTEELTARYEDEG